MSGVSVILVLTLLASITALPVPDEGQFSGNDNFSVAHGGNSYTEGIDDGRNSDNYSVGHGGNSFHGNGGHGGNVSNVVVQTPKPPKCDGAFYEFIHKYSGGYISC